MGISEVNPVVVGQATQKSDYDRTFDGVVALKQAGTERHLGGDANATIFDTSFVPVPGLAIVRIAKGLNLAGFIIEVHCTCRVDAGTGTFRLWDITAGAAVGSTQTFTNTTFALVILTGLDGLLSTSDNHEYRLEVKAAGAADLPQIANAKLVMR